MRSTFLFLAPALLAGAATAASAQTVPMVTPDGALLDISAEGHTSRVPDIATIRAGVTTQGQDRGGGTGGQCGAV